MAETCLYLSLGPSKRPWNNLLFSARSQRRKLTRERRNTVGRVIPAYFQHMQSVSGDTAEELQAYISYLSSHTAKFRKEINKAGRGLVFRLHEQEAQLERDLAWMKKVVGAYVFHRRTAERQKDEVSRMINSLPGYHCLIWIDWKQNVTIPLAHRQTSNMFWAQARMELSCLGIVVHAGQPSGGSKKLAFVILSDVIEHTSLAAALQLELLKGHLPMEQIREAHFWCDCGAHYRNLDLCAYLEMQWASREAGGIPISISFFGEKHGKGECDSLFFFMQPMAQRQNIATRYLLS
ncbi:unnamed protein product [Durusdinium trenchii]|uniref:Transposase n=1 Tax=Durusdinium trenchii TaxID=1381693 RepID=A0ABP0J4I3_9DINO